MADHDSIEVMLSTFFILSRDIMKNLNIMALSAPFKKSLSCKRDAFHLASATPFSLLNAFRGGMARMCNPESAWSRTDWTRTEDISGSVAMFDYLDDALAWIDAKTRIEAADICFIGAMTLSMPGALECARRLRARLGSAPLIVLGGKHATETMWIDETGTLACHASAAVYKRERQLFDIVVSGDAEDVVAEILEVSARFEVRGEPWRQALVRALAGASGDFCILIGDRIVRSEGAKAGTKKSRWDLPLVYEYFPIRGSFAVLGAEVTAHAYSYISKGCIYRCSFCSETASVNGPVSAPRILEAASDLARQFARLQALAIARGHTSLSIFVEDSIFLQGHPGGWEVFVRACAERGLVLPFGCQLTVDLILDSRRAAGLRMLKEQGLSYVFVGVETHNDAIAERMSKNIGRKGSWTGRSEQAIGLLAELGIDVGVSVLFGLGETQRSRVELLDRIGAWQRRGRQPKVVSLNWAVRHPLRTAAGAGEADALYEEWAVAPEDPRAPLMHALFGEASTRYPMPGCVPPTLADLRDIAHLYVGLENVL